MRATRFETMEFNTTASAFRFVAVDHQRPFEHADANQEARDDSDHDLLFGTVFSGPVIGTQLGAPIDALDDQSVTTSAPSQDELTDWSSNNIGEHDMPLATDQEGGAWPHIESSNVWNLF